MEPDLNKATTKEVIQTKWLTFAEIKEMYERGDCCLNMGDLYGFELNPVPQDGYRDIIGRIVKGKIDRPMGSYHPRHKNLYYPVNYGYVEGVMGGDGAEQDIYLLGETSAVTDFTGKVIAVSGGAKRELLDKPVGPQLGEIMEGRSAYRHGSGGSPACPLLPLSGLPRRETCRREIAAHPLPGCHRRYACDRLPSRHLRPHAAVRTGSARNGTHPPDALSRRPPLPAGPDPEASGRGARHALYPDDSRQRRLPSEI